jgi:uncharacterized protein YbjT (DUF2867 family)
MSMEQRRSHERQERLGLDVWCTSPVSVPMWTQRPRTSAPGPSVSLQYGEACPEAIILRPSVLFGGGDALFRSLAVIIRISPVFPLFGDGSTRLQPVFAGDVAEAVVKAVGSSSTRGKVYELGGPQVYRYRDLVELVLVHLNRRRVLFPVPFFVWEIQVSLLGILPNPPLTRDQVEI